MPTEVVVDLVSVRDVDEQEWRHVVDPGDLYQSHPWLRALDDAGDGPVTCLVARRPGGGRILGGLPLHDVLPSRGDLLYWPELHFQDLLLAADTHGGRLGLLAGSCAGFSTGLAVDRGLPPPERTTVLQALRDEACTVAAERGLAYVVALFLDLPVWGDLAPLVREGDHSRLAGVAQSELDLPGAGVADWLATLPRNTRTSVRREIGAFAAVCETELVPLRDVVALVAPMVVEVRAGHGTPYGVDAVARRLAEHAEAVGDDAARVLLCRSEGRLVGASVLCHWHDRLLVTDFGRSGGEETPAPFLYFNAAIYEPVRYAYAAGLSRVVTGAGAELGKARRGAAIRPLLHLAWAAGDGARRPAETTTADARRDFWRERRAAHPKHFGDVWEEVL